MVTLFVVQLVGVLKKNIALKRRSRKQLFFEIVYPIYFAVVLFLISRPLKDPISRPAECLGISGSSACKQSMPTPLRLRPAAGDCSFSREPSSVLLYSPANKTTDAIMADVVLLLRNATQACKIGFDTADAASSWYVSNGPAGAAAVAAAVHFDVRLQSYTISLPPNDAAWCPSCAPSPRLEQGAGWFQRDLQNVTDAHFLDLVWAVPLSLQWAVTRAVAMAHSDSLRTQLVAEAVWSNASAGEFALAPPLLGKMPLPVYSTSYSPSLHPFLSYILPLYSCWGLCAAMGYVVAMVVSEREKKLLDGLRMMGLSPLCSTLGWWIIYAGIFTFGATAMAVVSIAADLYPGCSALLLWITLELFAMATVAASFVVSSVMASARPSQGVATLFYLLGLGLFALNNALSRPPALERLLCLVPFVAGPVGILNFLQGAFEAVPLTSAQLLHGQTPLLFVWGYLVVDTALCISLAWYLEQVRFGGRSPAFVLSRAYWASGSGGEAGPEAVVPEVSSRLDEVREASTATELTPEIGTATELTPEIGSRSAGNGGDGTACGGTAGGGSGEAPSVAVELIKLGHSFAASPPVVALTDVSLQLHRGQVTALLGPNGAGKSTVIGILTGLYPPTSGGATVFGHSVGTQMETIRQLTGVCPQTDLLYDTLTCHEHLSLLGAIKGLSAGELGGQIRSWIEHVGLADKLHAAAGTLSGGQKRKLSLAMAMIADPHFVLLDEPTAGMDPESRRAVWSLIAKARASRSILLTTHFMEEADFLADRIAILARRAGVEGEGGTLRVVGTSHGLKTRWGAGYHLRFALAEAHDAAGLVAVVRAHVAEAVQEELQPRELTLLLPTAATASYPALFDALSVERMGGLGALSYGISLPSLQEIFLRVVDEDSGYSAPPTGAATEAGGDERAPLSTGDVPSDSVVGVGALPPPRFSSMLRTMVWTNVAVVRADPPRVGFSVAALLLAAAFIVPAVVPSGGGGASADSTLWANASIGGGVRPMPFLANPAGAAQRGLAAVPGAVWLGAPTGSPTSSAQRLQAAAHSDASLAGALGGVAPAGLHAPTLNGSGLWSRGMLLLFDSNFPNSPPLLQAAVDNALLGAVTPGLQIDPAYNYLPTNVSASDPSPSLPSTLKLVLTPLLFSVAAILLTLPVALHLVSDKEAACKHQLLLMGMDVRAYWLGAFLTYGALLSALLGLPAIVLASATGSLTPAAMPAMALVTLLTLQPILLSAFLLSFLFTKKETASQFYTVAMIMVSTVPNILASVIRDPTAKMAVQYAFLVVPINQLVGGVSTSLQIDLAASIAQQYGRPPPTPADFFVVSYDSYAGTVAGPGACLIAAVLSFVVYAALIYKLDVHSYLSSGHEPREPREPREPPTAHAATLEDDDVAAERARVEGSAEGSTTDWVRMRGLRKVYSGAREGLWRSAAPTVAVEGLSLGVARGTCFALLGPNGAGKTTALSMLTGSTPPTAGGAWVKGLSVRTDLLAVFKVTGFCPQFRGLWEWLTLREHLAIYLRLKGAPLAEVDAAAARIEADYGLTEHSSKMSRALSGGTRRKLSAAIAMACGHPDVVFLDEPTTGVDVGTRRFIWDRIKDSVAGRVILLTTHYMDEADALAHSIGIMAGGKLKVLGSPQHLKSRHGGGYRVEVSGPTASAQHVASLVHATFEGARPLETHGGLQSFEVGSSFGLARAFHALEAAKDCGDLYTYTLSQTTLEQVFLNIAGRDKEERALAGV